MVSRAAALSGRASKMVVASKHYVLKNQMEGPYPENTKKILFANGCFWGSEKGAWRLPGVYTTACGYSAGYTPNPTYEEVCSGQTGHTEVRFADSSTVAVKLLAQCLRICRVQSLTIQHLLWNAVRAGSFRPREDILCGYFALVLGVARSYTGHGAGQ